MPFQMSSLNSINKFITLQEFCSKWWCYEIFLNLETLANLPSGAKSLYKSFLCEYIYIIYLFGD